MGKKKQQQHVQQSMGNLVSKAALSKLGPEIEQIVQYHVQHLGSQLAKHQASTLENLFSRVVVLERIIMESQNLTADDLATKVANLEDEKEGLESAETVANGDVVRLAVKTKTKDQAEFQGESRLKLYNTGSGETIGQELEQSLIGMKTGETKTVEFGQNKELVAEISINRISRPKVEETEDVTKNEG